ncbi:MAG: dissimilatory-type sulfite reductase subunit beta, partial [Hyphomicrobiales bacterium]|nr:dissimilatory-type sulfite reductase subunit beta [Hyphomicrobiales bacterium]
MSEAKPRMPDEVGVPDPFPYMHPIMKANYGNWDWHDRPRPGVLHHVAKNGDQIWTVRAGTQRQMDVGTIRKLCDMADEFCDGHVRFTTRSNIEFLLGDESKVEPLIARLGEEGFPVGGTGNSVSMISHTQGWLHCDIPGTDASGVVKSMMDMLYDEFVKEEMPNRVRITTSCC